MKVTWNKIVLQSTDYLTPAYGLVGGFGFSSLHSVRNKRRVEITGSHSNEFVKLKFSKIWPISSAPPWYQIMPRTGFTGEEVRKFYSILASQGCYVSISHAQHAVTVQQPKPVAQVNHSIADVKTVSRHVTPFSILRIQWFNATTQFHISFDPITAVCCLMRINIVAVVT